MFELLKQPTTPKVPALLTLDELKRQKHWVCYNRRHTIISPVTRQTTSGRYPLSWGTYELAHRFMGRESSSIVGLGFMLTSDFGITVVDLHHCLFDGKLNEFAQEMVETLDSYTEIMPNGTSLRILVQSALPQHPSTGCDIEAEKRVAAEHPARFVIVTGNEWEVR